VLFNKCLNDSDIPKSWKNALIILVYKKGGPTELKNYRPISILSHLYKLFTKILTKRINKQLDERQDKDQAGFRTGRSTTDHIHTLNPMLEKPGNSIFQCPWLS